MKTAEELTEYHRWIMSKLTVGSFNEIVDEMGSLMTESDIGAIKIMLVLTKSFKEHPKLSEPRKALYKHYEYIFDRLKTTYNEKD